MEVEIRIDRGRCIGSGQCVHVAPGAFDQDDGALAFVTDRRGEPPEKIVGAVVACPMEAISLHFDGVAVGPRDLRDWTIGARSDEPVVALLEGFAQQHHDLLSTLAEATRDGHEDPKGAELVEAVRDHLRDEDEARSALAALVAGTLVDAFDREHHRITDAVDRLAESRDRIDRERAVSELVDVLEAHIGLEETVLFPAVLAAVARHENEADQAWSTA